MIIKEYEKYKSVSLTSEEYQIFYLDILNNPNADGLLNQYINDLDLFITMVEDYINGKKINKMHFDKN